jgi:hypothetical protein
MLLTASGRATVAGDHVLQDWPRERIENEEPTMSEPAVPAIAGIHHISFTVSDIEASLD